MYSIKMDVTLRSCISLSTEHVVYIIECKDRTLYTGYTNNLTNRLKMHEAGKGAKYTRGRGPFKLRFKQSFKTKEEAMRMEYQVKRQSRSKKLKIIKDKKIGE